MQKIDQESAIVRGPQARAQHPHKGAARGEGFAILLIVMIVSKLFYISVLYNLSIVQKVQKI